MGEMLDKNDKWSNVAQSKISKHKIDRNSKKRNSKMKSEHIQELNIKENLLCHKDKEGYLKMNDDQEIKLGVYKRSPPLVRFASSVCSDSRQIVLTYP